MDLQDALRLNPLFHDMDRKALQALGETAQWRELRGGESLYRVGDQGDALYLVVNGRIRVSQPEDNGRDRILGEFARGETVGEISLLTGEHFTVNAVAVRDSVLVRISSRAFERLLYRHPQAMFRVTRMIVERLRHAGQQAGNRGVASTRTYAVLPAHGGIDIRGFSQSYARHLADGGSVLRLDAQRVEDALGPDMAQTPFDDTRSNQRVVAWLNRLEDRYRYLVYQAGARPDAWSRRCMRQADRILVIAHAGQAARGSDNLDWLAESMPDAVVELVLIADEPDHEQAAQAVAEWRVLTRASFHYHVDAGLPAKQMQRLCRLSSGRAVCLVLGGGGARGFAHVGLLRALSEKGVPVDAVGGTSMGALIGAMVACDMSHEAILQTLRATFVDKNYLNDYSIASRMRVSMIGARKFMSHLAEIFGDRDIENLPLPFYCASSNLSNGKAVVHDRGPVVDWVGTSMAVPGIAPPMVYQGDLLVDGGLLHSVPLDTMCAMGRGFVLASDVGGDTDLRLQGVAQDTPQPLNDIRDLPKNLTIFKILFHAATLASENEERELDTRADLAIHMPVGETGMFDWDEIDNIIYRAYYHASEVLDRCLQDNPDLPRAVPRAHAPPSTDQ